ncbi:ubiquinol oxidase subunit II [Paracoccus sp. R12_1]|uniref:ubiquinol oxidase subunit II n=1 Tax=unclassified Paracoccus (in: a-proteobacteria) TaxID=2688777 RepID=UPI001AD95E57|nr:MULTISPECIES: ubiquinol oxidase subunit II [unclassified Paracoccus (in: a-proteobacteria)]MBO9454884.1 ubiquinol oxidase subunit II [Paracoccus sp. R12_2]MBO9485428.1 ubiquinol oxidase subunit II [Paracoccus sp. R12_1]
MRILPPAPGALALGMSFLLLTGCKPVVLAPAGDIAERQKDLLLAATGLMLIVIIPVMCLTLWFAWKYRAANRQAAYRPDWDHSAKFELAIWGLPLLIIICLGALTWVGTHLLDPYRPLDRLSATEEIAEDHQPLKVQVVALDWKWLFIYPEQDIAAVNELVVPTNREIEFSLTASSVMNAFYIPAMAGMIYAMPGMETKLHGVFNHEGEYQGLASHYSGAGFSGMRFKAHATDTAGFDDWVSRARAGQDALTRDEYLRLEAPSENVAPRIYAEVDPDLFARAVNLCVEDGKMCMAEMMDIDSKGGLGLEGTINIQSLTHDKHARRGARPVLGHQPVMVTSICTPEEAALMFADLGTTQPTSRADQTRLQSRALPVPDSLFDRLIAPTIRDASKTAGTADQKL